MSAGTLSLTNKSATVSGTGTSFTTDLKAGDFIVVKIGGTPYTLPVKTITSNTQLTLVSNYTGPTQSGVAWFAVPQEAQSLITASLASQTAEALRGLNYDKQNWQQVYSGTGNITVKLPDGSSYTGPAWGRIVTTLNGKAGAGANSDITSLSGLSPNLTLRGTNATEGHGNGVICVSNDPVEASFGIANIGGGTAVFHNYARPADSSGIGNGALIGGYGSRPWTGSTYTDHSNVSQHFLMDGTSSPTNHGGWFRLLTTPLNATVNNRRQTFATSNNGDLYAGYDVPMGLYSLSKFGGFGGLEGLDGRGFKQINNTANELILLTPRNGNTANINIRGVAFDGTAEGSKGATQPGDNMWVSFTGHNGTSFTNAAAGMRIQASTGWSTTNNECGITIATTQQGSTTRVDRWRFTSDGSFSPAFDNVYAIGSPVSRCTAIWATNGTIQTSDARMKTEVRPLTEDELSAASAIAKEIGFFRWLERVEVEGDAARMHAGITVQRVMDIMASYGLDPMHYGFVCHDVWEEQTVFSADPDDDAKSTVRVIPAGDRYSLRYTELSMFLARGMEQRLTTLEAQIAALTSQ